MRKKIWLAVGVALWTWPSLAPLQAHESVTGSDGMGTDRHEDETKHWPKDLNLTPEQSNKLLAIHESARQSLKPLRDQEHALAEKLEIEVKSKAPDSEIQKTLDDLKAGRKAMIEQMERMENQKNAVLTPTQQAKMVLKHKKHMEHFGGHPSNKEGTPASETPAH